MDRLWSPWRYEYVSTTEEESVCVFCQVQSEQSDEENYIVHRASKNYVILNRFPYTTGHLMVVPYEHVATLEEASTDTLTEMILLTRRAEGCLRAVYRPSGLNIGMNVGKCAGAGVAGHIHMHVLPRWASDVNFVTAIGETRVLPEDLSVTFKRLVKVFPKD